MASCFLSYGRKDDEAFVERLRDDLVQREIQVWWDRLGMRSRGIPFLNEIDDAIRLSDRFVLIAGPHALASDYVQHELAVAEANCKIIIPVLKQCSISALPSQLQKLHVFDLDEDNDRVYQQLIVTLSNPAEPLGPLLGDIPPHPGHLIDRGDGVDTILEAILADVQNPIAICGNVKPTTVTGMGGIGKTILAMLVAKCCSVRRSFADGVLFARLRPESTALEVVNSLRHILGDQSDVGDDLNAAASVLTHLIARSRHLIVLDNVWSSAQIASVTGAVSGTANRLMFTTRRKDLAAELAAQVYEVKLLTQTQALHYLADWLNVEPRTLPSEAHEIVRRCGRLPLALSICGALLARGTPWIDLVAAMKESELRFLDLEVVGYEHHGVFSAIDVGVKALSSRDAQMAKRYRMLAAFDTDAPVPERVIFKLWGITSDQQARIARRQLRELEASSLLSQLSNQTVLLHDVQRAYLLADGANVIALRKKLIKAYRDADGSWSSVAEQDPWLRNHLAHFMKSYGDVDELGRLLTEQPSDGKNAWYELRSLNGELDGYWSDLTAAQESLNWSDPNASIPFAIRLVTIRSSLLSMANNMPGPLVVASVRTGVWQPPRGRALIARTPRAEDRIEALTDLLLVADTEQQTIIKEIFSTLVDQPNREHPMALYRLARNIPIHLRRVAAAATFEFFDVLASKLSGWTVAAVIPLLEPHDYARARKSIDRMDDAMEQAVACGALSRLLGEDEAYTEVLDLLRAQTENFALQVRVAEAAARGSHGPVDLLVGQVLTEALDVAHQEGRSMVGQKAVQKLLPLVSDETLRHLAPSIDTDTLCAALRGSAWEITKVIGKCASKEPLRPGLVNCAREIDPPMYGTACLAAILVHTEGAIRNSILNEVVSRLRNRLDLNQDMDWLGDVAQHFGHILNELPSDVRKGLIDGIEKIYSLKNAARAISGLASGLNPMELCTAIDKQLDELERTPSTNDTRDPLAMLAPLLSKQQVEKALGVASAARDDGFETGMLGTLIHYLKKKDRDLVHGWVLDRAMEHLSRVTDKQSQRDFKEIHIVKIIQDLVNEGCSPFILRRAYEIVVTISRPEYKARARAALASVASNKHAVALWSDVNTLVGQVNDISERAVLIADLASIATGRRRAHFIKQALDLEANIDNKYVWSDVLMRLPLTAEVSKQAIKLLGRTQGGNPSTPVWSA